MLAAGATPVVDLSQVEFADLATVRALLAGKHVAEERERALLVVPGDSYVVRRVLDLSATPLDLWTASSVREGIQRARDICDGKESA